MKYNIGDKVKIKSDLKIDGRYAMENSVYSDVLVDEMSEFSGKEAVIERAEEYGYSLNVDNEEWNWTDDMLEQI